MSRHLEIARLGKSFATPRGPFVAVEAFDLTLATGEFVALIGHSGCGKSTVLSMVAGLTQPSTGGIALAGREIDGPGPDRGVVFQSPALLPWLSVLENVLLGVDRVFAHGTSAERRAIAEHHLCSVGLGDMLAKSPREISQGERQRVGIARALALAPKLLLLDEPFGMLDSLTRLELQDMLAALLARTRTTALMVTHDVDEALFLADRVAMMTKGPRARIGALLEVRIPRPRVREAVLEHPDYYGLREELISFLEHQDASAEARAERGLAAAEASPLAAAAPQ
ncbi:MAG TPA: nitrate ABC transporter ATP-binding protein [Myxococcota bacterium]|jgi:nitrate ABC transporter ATP-binding subunit